MNFGVYPTTGFNQTPNTIAQVSGDRRRAIMSVVKRRTILIAS